MADPKTRGEAAPTPPPKLDRVPAGYQPPSHTAAVGAGRAAAPPPAAPGPTYGLAAREITASAAMAAGLGKDGTLDEESALHLFYLATALQTSGRVTVAPEGRTPCAIVFRKGAVVHAASSDPEDGLVRFLLAKGAIQPDHLARAEAGRAAAGGDLVAALVTQRLVNPADVAALLQEHGARVVARALAAERGRWRFEPGVAAPPSAFPLGSSWSILCGAVRALDLGAVKRRLGDREERVAARVGGRIRLEDLRLTAQEARVAALFDGVRSPAELAAAQPSDAATILRVALLLAEVELLAAGAVRKAAAAPLRPPPTPTSTPTSPSPSPSTPTPTPTSTSTSTPTSSSTSSSTSTPTPSSKPSTPASTPSRPPAPTSRPTAPPPRPPAPAVAKPPPAVPRTPLDPAALRALHEKLAGEDHFQVLGVKRDASAAQVKVAYFQLAKLYHPDAVPTIASPEVKKRCADVFARVSEAWSVLGDEGRRAKYLQELTTGGAADVDVMAILQAENQFQLGTVLVRSRRYDEALEKFVEAVKLNPDEPEFGIWKAWCEFLVAEDKTRQQPATLAAIEAGLARNPRCAPGYLFLGQMAKVNGDLGAAEKHLRRGLAVAPEDPELARELKYLRK